MKPFSFMKEERPISGEDENPTKEIKKNDHFTINERKMIEPRVKDKNEKNCHGKDKNEFSARTNIIELINVGS